MEYSDIEAFVAAVLAARAEAGVPNPSSCLGISPAAGGPGTRYAAWWRHGFPALVTAEAGSSVLRITVRSQEELDALIAVAGDAGVWFNDTRKA